jgi:catechol 2,3-dioxygenase-like lactoylglutathione lyase family enzyme
VTKTVLDHVAVGARTLTDGWELFGGVLGGTWGYGGYSPGYWWGQLQFSSGPKIELLTPTGGPDSAFLERFLTARGPGPHHFNFIVPDITAALSRVQAAGIEPIQVSLENPAWKEAFLHPRDAYGIVIQLAEQSGPPPEHPAPRELPVPGPPSSFALVEHHVGDLAGATTLFATALEGNVVAASGSSAELAWDNGARLRLVETAEVGQQRPGGRIASLHFSRDHGAFGGQDVSLAGELGKRLGVVLELGG